MLSEQENILKSNLRKLIGDFKNNYQKYRKELEANTETKLIEPLFGLLGWDKQDFVKQESTRKGEKRME